MTPPYAILPAEIVESWARLSPAAKAVAGVIAAHMNGKSHEARLLEKTMAVEAGYSQSRSVRGALLELERSGLLRRGCGGHHSCNFYSWTTPGQKQGPALADRAESGLHPGPSGRNAGARRAEPRFHQNVNVEHKTSSRDASRAGGRNQDSTLTGRRRGKPEGPISAPKATSGPDVWAWWIEVSRDAGRPDPLGPGPDIRAGKELGRFVSRGDITESELRRIMLAYLKDADPWLAKQGHPLRLLAGRIERYRLSRSIPVLRCFRCDCTSACDLRPIVGQPTDSLKRICVNCIEKARSRRPPSPDSIKVQLKTIPDPDSPEDLFARKRELARQAATYPSVGG